jgi:capsular polysaccharide transport system permease protein
MWRRIGRFFYEVSEGWRRMESVVFALIFKEFKNRAGRDNRLGMLWLLLDPLMLTLSMSVMWSVMGREALAGVSVVLFIAVGTAPYNVFMLGLGSVPRSLKSNRMFYNYQQVKPFDSVLAEFILELTLVVIGLVGLFFLLWWFGDLAPDFANVMPIFAIIGLAGLTAIGMALLLATYGAIYDPLSKAMNFLTRPMLFVSPIFYPVNGLPDSARYLLSWNPLSHLIELARYYALGVKPFPEAGFTYPLVFALVALFLGLVAYYPNRQRLLQT